MATAQNQPRGQCDQCRRAVADGRPIGDIAAHGAAGANLRRTQAAQQLTEVRIILGDRGQQAAIGNPGADLDHIRLHLEMLQFPDLAQINHGLEAAVLLGHPERDVGSTGQQAGFRIFDGKPGQIVDFAWREEPPAIRILELRRGGPAQRLERFD